MKVRLTPRADAQLRALPDRAARRLVDALRLLEAAPRSGRPCPDDSPFAGSYFKHVVLRARRWSYRITCDLVEEDDEIWVRYVYPSWFPLTHPDLVVGKPGRPRRRR